MSNNASLCTCGMALPNGNDTMSVLIISHSASTRSSYLVIIRLPRLPYSSAFNTTSTDWYLLFSMSLCNTDNNGHMVVAFWKLDSNSTMIGATYSRMRCHCTSVSMDTLETMVLTHINDWNFTMESVVLVIKLITICITCNSSYSWNVWTNLVARIVHLLRFYCVLLVLRYCSTGNMSITLFISILNLIATLGTWPRIAKKLSNNAIFPIWKLFRCIYSRNVAKFLNANWGNLVINYSTVTRHIV